LELKTCTKCQKTKVITEFGIRKGKYRKPGDRHAECKACTAARRRNRYHNEPGFKRRVAEIERKHHEKLRLDLLARYGGKCACCPETEYKFLSFDHIDNDGAEHRREHGDGAKYLMQWIKRNNYPDTIQILCYNCNCAKGFYGECPHETNRKRLAEMSNHVNAS
jgi:hypothetical protein